MYNDVVPSGGPNGVAAAYGKLFTTVGGVGDVVCLDPATGNEVWKTNIRGPREEGITTSPLVYNNLVIVSTIPGSSKGFYIGGQRGVVHALDAASGEVLWYFDTTTDNLWGNPTVNSGGGFWHPPSVDEDGQIYIPVANPAPYPGTKDFPWGTSRPGDNLYTDSIIKMNPENATIDWYYQVNPHDLFDADNQLTPVLFDLSGRKAVVTTGKHGVVYCLDRSTGEVIWKTPVGTHNNDTIKTDQGDKSISVSPGTLGGVETQPAYHEASGLMIFPVYELPTQYIGSGIDPKVGLDFSTATGLLVAINVKDGSIAWQTKLASGPVAGATITNDIVFSAGLDGVIRAFTVADGKEVYNYQAPAGINAQLAVSGDYVYVAAGGPLMSKSGAKAAFTVVALKLGGDTSMASPVAEAPAGATPEGSTQGSGAAPGPNSSTPEASTPTS
jgi:outer membrane protein assembly factor BamB